MRLHASLTFSFAALLASAGFGQSELYQVWGFGPGFDFGRSLVAVGDTNGDGGAEYYVGAPGAQGALGGIFGTTTSGTIYLLNGVDGDTLRTYNGTAVSDFYGTRIDTIGDLDADGVPEIIVGAPQSLYVPFKSSWQSSTGDGYVHIRSGLVGDLIRTHADGGPGSAYGMAAAGIGDVDGDSMPDYAIGAPRGASGEVYVYSGVDGSLIRQELAPAGLSTGWGWWIESCGDADGDGVPDHLVSSVPEFSQVADYGVTCVSGADGSVIWVSSERAASNSEWGYRTVAIDDLNGDGLAEVVAGAKRFDESRGYAEWLDGATGAVIHHEDGKAKFGTFGASLAYLGDLDGDGQGDTAIGSPFEAIPFGFGARAIRVFSGDSGAVSTSILADPLHNFSFGTSYAGADLDGNGTRELIVGSPLEDQTFFCLSGRIEVFTNL